MVSERLDYYTGDELEPIAVEEGARLGVRLVPEAAALLARGSRGTPRLLLGLLRRSRDLAILESGSLTEISIDAALAERALESQGLDASGLCELDRKIIDLLLSRRKPLGLRTLSDLLGENMKTLAEVYEPCLLRQGYLIRTHRARAATAKARELLRKSA